VTYVINDRYRDTNTGYSLMLAAPAIGTSEFIKFDADVVFDVKILRQLVDSDHANVLCIDQNIALEDEEVKVITDDHMQVLEVGKSVDPKLALGESIGIEKISAKTGSLLFAELDEMMENREHFQEYYEAAYARLVVQGTVFRALDITGVNWTEIDTATDYAAANAMFGTPISTISRRRKGRHVCVALTSQHHPAPCMGNGWTTAVKPLPFRHRIAAIWKDIPWPKVKTVTKRQRSQSKKSRKCWRHRIPTPEKLIFPLLVKR
jgi:choline kinase